MTYTFIIPHYNIPQLLTRCLQSIPKRDDIQVIVVDDCSPDASRYKTDYPELSRPGLEYYSTDRGGSAGRARNVGLDHARGEWLLFADADDCFLPAINDILEHLSHSKADIVYFDVKSYDVDRQSETQESEYFNTQIRNALADPDYGIKFRYDVPWGKAVRRDVVVRNGIRFEETYCSNDSRFAAVLGHYAQHIEVLPTVGYCWMTRSGSLWRNKNVSWYTTRIGVHLRIIRFMQQHHEADALQIHTTYATNFLFQLQDISFWHYVRCAVSYGITLSKYGFLFRHLPKQVIKHICQR